MPARRVNLTAEEFTRPNPVTGYENSGVEKGKE